MIESLPFFLIRCYLQWETRKPKTKVWRCRELRSFYGKRMKLFLIFFCFLSFYLRSLVPLFSLFLSLLLFFFFNCCCSFLLTAFGTQLPRCSNAWPLFVFKLFSASSWKATRNVSFFSPYLHLTFLSSFYISICVFSASFLSLHSPSPSFHKKKVNKRLYTLRGTLSNTDTHKLNSQREAKKRVFDENNLRCAIRRRTKKRYKSRVVHI